MDDISHLVERIVMAVDLSSDGRPDWQQFLHAVISVSGAEYVDVRLADGNQIGWNASHLKDESAVVKKNIFFCPEKSKDWIEISLSFNSKEPVLSQNAELAIRTGLGLMLDLYLAFKRKELLQVLSEELGFIVLTLDRSGKLLYFPKGLSHWLSMGLLKEIGGRIFFKDYLHWIKQSMQALDDSCVQADSEIPAFLYRVIVPESFDEDALHTFHCFISKEEGQICFTDDPVYKLTIFRNCNHVDALSLHQWLDCNESEAIIASEFATGMSAKDVANKTGFSLNTVYSYMKKLYEKLNIKSQSQLTYRALQQMHRRTLYDS